MGPVSVKPVARKIKEKIVSDRGLLAQILSGLKSQGKVIVFTNGCFDLIHVGHVRALEDAKSRGDFLVVGINTDESVARIKGKGHPITPEKERAEVVAAMEPVDYVTFFSEDTADAILEELRPDIFAKGHDYTEKTVPERKTAKAIGAKIIIVGDKKRHSTSELIKRIKRKRKV